MDVIDKVLTKAKSQVGVREKPLGSNSGPEVNAYLRAAGFGPGAPWCDAFVAWCFQQVEQETDTKIPCVKTASCDVSLQFGRSHECLHATPQRGDQFLVLASANDATHTGFVSGVNGNSFTTIEGNTNDNGSADGIGVFARTRNLSSKYRFVRWAQLMAGDTTYGLMLNGQKIADMPVQAGVARCAAQAWGKAMGFTVAWDSEAQAVLFDDKPVPAQPMIVNGAAFLPIRVLVESAGLHLEVDSKARIVTVSRA